MLFVSLFSSTYYSLLQFTVLTLVEQHKLLEGPHLKLLISQHLTVSRCNILLGQQISYMKMYTNHSKFSSHQYTGHRNVQI